MLERIQRELPALAKAVVAADIEGAAPTTSTETGAADAVREAVEETKQAARSAGDQRAKRSAARQARRVPGAAQAEGAAKGAVASEEDLPIAGYDSLNADDIVARLPEPLAGRPREGRRLRAQGRPAARRCSTGSRRCAATSRGPDTTT